MTIKELIVRSQRIIDKRMKLDRLSRFYGSPVFKKSRREIDERTIREIQDALFTEGIFSHLEVSSRKFYLKVLRGQEANRKNSIFIHIFLFVLTIGTTMVTGSMFKGKNPFESLSDFYAGAEYSFALLTILFFHEMGHYLYARYYKVRASLPYFIPLFLPAFHPGTFGAFIKIRSSIPNKKALFDIGIAGPLAGLLMSIIFLTIGFARLPDEAGIYYYISQIHPLYDSDGVNLILGNTLLFDGIASVFDGQRLPMNEVYHFPFIFAGWFGLLVTALNLMPIGQLDGGHITYAMFGDKARYMAFAFFGLLILLNVYIISNYNSYVWVLWPILILVFIRFRHPPTMDDSIPIDSKRKILGWISYIIFILCFSPIPLYIGTSV